MDESRIGQYSISVTTYPIMALIEVYFIGFIVEPTFCLLALTTTPQMWCFLRAKNDNGMLSFKNFQENLGGLQCQVWHLKKSSLMFVFCAKVTLKVPKCAENRLHAN